MTDEHTRFRYFASEYCQSLIRTIWSLDTTKMWQAVQAIRECKGTVWLIGNGGSATLASHMATDLQLAGVRAQSLTDVAAVTTYGNDHGYDYSFADQVTRLVQSKDILIAISGSGSSINIHFAVLAATSCGAKVIAVTGFDGGRIQDYCWIHLHVPVKHMGRSQDGHQIILHIICYYLMERLKHDEKVSTTGTCSYTIDSCPARYNGLRCEYHHMGPRVL